MKNGEEVRVDPTEETRLLLRFTLRAALALLIALLFFRTFIAVPYGIPSRSMAPTIVPGDVLLVNKLPYYIRTPVHIPFTGIEIPYLEIPGTGNLDYGEVVVFSSPEPGRSGGSSELVKRVVALPGDAVQLTDSGLNVRRRDGSRYHYRGELPTQIAPVLQGGRGVIVPREGQILRLNGRTAARWSRVLRREGVEVDYRNNIVFLNGEPATRYRFRRDYFMALGDNRSGSRDSRSFGFIPHNALIGEATFILWSRDPQTGDVRWERVGRSELRMQN